MTRRRSLTPVPRTHGRPRHVPVLTEEVVQYLARSDGQFIDSTIGDGGHAEALLRASGTGARLLGLDTDAESVARAQTFLQVFGEQVVILQDTYAHVAEVASRVGWTRPTGILFDLGMATHHLDVERGFSFKNLGTLDMRFDAGGTLVLPEPELPSLRRLVGVKPSYTAADILSSLYEDELSALLELYGEERHAARIAQSIVSARRDAPITAVPELVQLIVRALPARARHGRIHAATKTFQALRIAVNREWESIRHGIRGALSLLSLGSRLAVITFHSSEDRLVKRLFIEAARTGACSILTKHAVQPTWNERKQNPWSRSAHLRVIENTTHTSSF